MDFTTLTVEALTFLSSIVGGYGLAIIVLTVAIRLIMWPLSVSQQRSMKKMQTLSPKLKEIQARYSKDPQMMQKKMMEFYKEQKFNPMGGCFPMLLQLPVFILLYTALMSPAFNSLAGDSSFFFIKRLDATMQSHSGVSGDKIFGVASKDSFSTQKTAKVYFNDGSSEEVKVVRPKTAIEIQGDLKPGEPVDLKVNLDSLKLTFSQLEQVQKADFVVSNNGTKEFENLTFDRKGSVLASTVDTNEVKTTFHYDVLALVILFGVTMFFSQKLLTGANSSAQMDEAQKKMQESMANVMPVMIMAMFVFIPIPAGVLLYMVVSNIIQVLQTVVINKQIAKEELAPKQTISNDSINDAKNITDNKNN